MGIFFDLMQQNMLADQQTQADSIEDRVELLETELRQTKELLIKTLHVLEEHVGKDIDGDGETG
jgi:hypothetical protein